MASQEREKSWRRLLTPVALGGAWVLLVVLVVSAIHAITGWPFFILWVLLGLPAVTMTVPVARMLGYRVARI